MNKTMYERCLNKDKIIWENIPTDIKEQIMIATKIQTYNYKGQWVDMIGLKLFCVTSIVRIHPDTIFYDDDIPNHVCHCIICTSTRMAI